MARRDDDDDAPWLAEAVARPSTDVSKRSLFWTLLVLLSIATVAAVGLVMLLSKKDSGSTQGYMEPDQAPLITAEPGPYKVPPLDPKGLEVEGEGQTIYAAGQGIDEGSVIDTNAGPEAPLPRPGTAQPVGPPQDLLAGMARETPALPPAPAPQPTARATAPAIVAGQSLAKSITIPPPAPAKVAVKAAPPPAAPAKKPGLVQLGAFSSKEKADAAWSALAGKAALNGFGKRIMVVESDGKTLYRLRASGGDAAELCRSLKAAGAPCTVIE